MSIVYMYIYEGSFEQIQVKKDLFFVFVYDFFLALAIDQNLHFMLQNLIDSRNEQNIE